MEALNNTILDCLEKGKDFGLATIMTQKGSTPRTSGSRMVVLRDQTIFGTIGGGMVEAMAIEACLDCLDQKTCQIREFNLDKELNLGRHNE